VRRGDLKYLILELLQKKPMHGYEIMKVLSETFKGFYFPSAGAVYPTLQALEDMQYITCSPDVGKKVYSVTPDGRKFLEDKSERFEKIRERKNHHLKRKDLMILRDCESITNLVMSNFEDLTPEEREEIDRMIGETKNKIREIVLNKSGT
jgi:DNA-binding PadR family transcriptional regulator